MNINETIITENDEFSITMEQEDLNASRMILPNEPSHPYAPV